MGTLEAPPSTKSSSVPRPPIPAVVITRGSQLEPTCSQLDTLRMRKWTAHQGYMPATQYRSAVTVNLLRHNGSKLHVGVAACPRGRLQDRRLIDPD